MFTVIYTFKTHPDQEAKFEKAWKDMTHLIYNYEGSLGSRLHRKKDGEYLAYAQWPDRKTWKNSGDKMPEYVIEVRKSMADSCSSIETLYELEVVDDLLQSKLKNS